MTYIGNYRVAEGELLDIRQDSARDFLSKHFPAVMANKPCGRSDGYQFMPTWKMAEILADNFDMGIAEVGQQKSRARSVAGQEHFIKLRYNNEPLNSVGDSRMELIIMNSHNGRSTLRVYAGLFRMVCANGLVVSDKSFGRMNLRHFGIENSFQAFEAMLGEFAEGFTKLNLRMVEMKATDLTIGQQQSLARKMMEARKAPNWVEPNMVLEPRRAEDAVKEDGKRDLWTTFNVIQENLANSDKVAAEAEGRRRRSLRPLSGARAHILTNEALWGAMEEFVADRFPALAVIDAVAVENEPEQAAPEAAPVVAEGHQPEEAGQEEPIVRQEMEADPEVIFAGWLKAATYDDLEALTDEQRAEMTPEQRKKVSSRKSYLKRK